MFTGTNDHLGLPSKDENTIDLIMGGEREGNNGRESLPWQACLRIHLQFREASFFSQAEELHLCCEIGALIIDIHSS
jgi:hypothetical protein